MKKLKQIRAVLGILAVFCMLGYTTSCTKSDTTPFQEDTQVVTESNVMGDLPLITPYHLQEQGREALPMNATYVQLVEENPELKAMVFGSENGSTASARDHEILCPFFDFHTCEDDHDCTYCTYLAQHCHWVAYYYWFHDPTPENCVTMQHAYCDYLVTFYNCYGGGPVTASDCYGDSTCN